MSLNEIGWIGLGTMGIPMCRSLLKAGYSLTVYNRDRSKAEQFAKEDAKVADSPAALINGTEVLIIMVTDDKAIHELFKADDGILSANTTGKLIINMSTVSPAVSKEMTVLCAEQGNNYIDAPVSGSVKQATEATLVILAGGEQAVFEQAKPILETLGKLAIYFGEAGAGNKAKLVINSFLAVQTQALAEAMVFAEELELSQPELLNVLNNSALGSPFVKIKGDAILNQAFNPAFTLSNAVKDLKLAKDIGLSSPLGLTALQTFTAAETAYGTEDIIAVFKALRTTR